VEGKRWGGGGGGWERGDREEGVERMKRRARSQVEVGCRRREERGARGWVGEEVGGEMEDGGGEGRGGGGARGTGGGGGKVGLDLWKRKKNGERRGESDDRRERREKEQGKRLREGEWEER